MVLQSFPRASAVSLVHTFWGRQVVLLLRSATPLSLAPLSPLRFCTATIGAATVGFDSVDKRARLEVLESPAGAVFSSGVSEASRVLLSEGAILRDGTQLEEIADFSMIEKIELHLEISGFSRREKVQNLPASGSSSEVSAHQMARSEIVSASGISSQLSAHQMAQPSSSSSVSVPPSIPDSWVL